MEETGLSSLTAGRGARTLAARVAARDRSRFVGRTCELGLLERCLSRTIRRPASSSSTDRAGSARARCCASWPAAPATRGFDTFFVEGRELPPMPDALEAVLAGARDSEQPLVLIDTYERMTALDGYLRRGLLPVAAGPHRRRHRRPRCRRTRPGSAAAGKGVATELELEPSTSRRGAEPARRPRPDGRACARGRRLGRGLAAGARARRRDGAADSDWTPGGGQRASRRSCAR